jgi:PKD repeat protein
MNSLTVYLFQPDHFLFSTTTTDNAGYYHFPNLPYGSYYLQFTLRPGYRFSPQDVGTNDTKDSDVDIVGTTPVFSLPITQSTQRWDAGMHLLTPSKPRYPSNHPPTADASAGEPYTGFVTEFITFNGSRSYDRDGRIITWLWNYGDGTTGSGETTTHAYTQVGVYLVTLTVTDNLFASDVYTTTAQVTQGNTPPTTPVIIGPTFAHAHSITTFFLVSTDFDNDTIRYIIDWDDGPIETTKYSTSGIQITQMHLWEKYGFYTITIYASDSNNAVSPSTQMKIAIDVEYIAHLGYLIDTNADGIFDVFHSNSTKQETPVKITDNGDYLIDLDGDTTWDIIYNPTTHQYQDYQPFPLIESLLFIFLLITLLLIYQIIRVKRQTRVLSRKKK